jgi:hypothetical protein
MLINTGQISGSRFHLEVDGESAGYLSSFQPPTYEAEDAGASLGPDYVTKKMLGGPKIGDATAVYNISQAGPLLRWIESVWEKKCRAVTATVHLANQNYKIQRAVEMMDSLITEVSFPELNASEGKKAFEVTAKWRPEGLNFTQPGGSVQSVLGQKAKSWMCSNFEVGSVFGLDTQWVTSMGLPKIGMKVTTEVYGETRQGIPLYSSIDFSTVKMSLGSAAYTGAMQLAQKTIRDGNVTESDGQDIIVEMRDQSLQRVLGTFTLRDCLLKKFEWAPKLEGGKDGPSVTNLEFLVEDFRFEIAHR